MKKKAFFLFFYSSGDPLLIYKTRLQDLSPKAPRRKAGDQKDPL